MTIGEAGEPVTLYINSADMVECSLLMSTIDPMDISFHEECQENTRMVMNDEILASDITSISSISASGPIFHREDNSNINSNIQIIPPAIEETTLASSSHQITKNDQIEELLPISITASRDGNAQKRCAETVQNVDIHMDDDEEMFLIEAASQYEQSLLSQENPSNLNKTNAISLENEIVNNSRQIAEEDEVIPQSPPSTHKRDFVKRIFKRCFEKTYVAKEVIPGDTHCCILDSDESED